MQYSGERNRIQRRHHYVATAVGEKAHRALKDVKPVALCIVVLHLAEGIS